MPQGDRKGSQGQGPKGGRGLGKCNSKNSTPIRGGQGSAGDGRGQCRGLGKGAGRGQGRGKGAGQARRRQS